ncbi:MAG: exosortase/archaeosortase family protein [Phycisphaerales bacterium JB063]
MTSTPVSNLPPANADTPLLGKPGRVWVVVFGLLIIFLHLQFFRRMMIVGLDDGDWSHILVIPFISIYYIYTNRERILAQPRRVCLWGLPLIVAGIFGYAMGITPIRNDMAQGYSIILAIFGLLLLLLGPRAMRILWFPVAFLVFGVKVSDAIWSVVAGMLQYVAARGAVMFINMLTPLTDMYAEIRGSTIDLDYTYQGVITQTPLNVAEACSGLRMLMAFLALGVALAFLFPRRWWQRLALVLLAAPIAIFVNTLRVTVLALLYLVDPNYAQGQFHIFVGMLMLIPAAGLLMFVGWCLEKMIVGEIPDNVGQPVPPKHDPQRFDVDWSAFARGLVIGIAIMAAAGIAYLFLLNHITDGILTDGLSFGWPTVLNLVGVGAMLVGLAVLAVFLRKLVGKPMSDYRWFASLGLGLGVLATASVGNAAMTKAMNISLVKKPVPLQYNLAAEFPKEFNNWVLVSQDARLGHDLEDELGATEYITAWFLNTDTGRTLEDLDVKLSEPEGRSIIQGYNPGEVVALHIAYYTGIVDTVPHVPDKCWIVAGGTVAYRANHGITLAGEQYRDDPESDGLLARSAFGYDVRIPRDDVEMVIFAADMDGGARSAAAYFFVANGDYMASSHKVRFSFRLRDRHAYYCKVEVRFPGINDPDQVQVLAEEFLSDLMPQVMAILPDWTEVQAGRYPGPNGLPPARPAQAEPDDDASANNQN